MGINDRSRHEFRRFITGIAKHQALVARSNNAIFPIDALVDVGRLPIKANLNLASFWVNACLAEMGIAFEDAGDMVLVPTKSAQELAQTLLEHCHPEKLLTRPATLEDVFLKLTGRRLRE